MTRRSKKTWGWMAMWGLAMVLLLVPVVGAAQAAVVISHVGDNLGWDETNQPAYLSTNVAKGFDVNGDNVYGTSGENL